LYDCAARGVRGTEYDESAMATTTTTTLLG